MSRRYIMGRPEYPDGTRVYNIDTDEFGHILSSRHMISWRKCNCHDPYIYKIQYGNHVSASKGSAHLCSGEIRPDDPKELAVGRRFTERTVRFFKGTAGYLNVFPFIVESTGHELWFDVEWPCSGQTPHLHVWRNETDARNWANGFSLLLNSNTSYEHDLSTINGTSQEELDTITNAFNTKLISDDVSIQTLWERFMNDLAEAGEEYTKYKDYISPPLYDLSTMDKVYTL